jgi:hypothetical protein
MLRRRLHVCSAMGASAGMLGSWQGPQPTRTAPSVPSPSGSTAGCIRGCRERTESSAGEELESVNVASS